LETEYIAILVERIYDDFVKKVSEGRGMTYEEVDEIGQGRVWSGSDALKVGLVDEIGGLERAVELAAELAKVKKYTRLELPKQESPFESLISDFSKDVEASIVEKHFVGYYGAFSDLYRSLTEGGIYMRLPFGFMVE
jgi:protease-4